MKRLFLAAALISLFAAAAFGQDADVKARFESEYQAWKTIVEGSSSSLSHFNPHLYEIAKMGIPVLPLLIDKMERKGFDRDFLLGKAFGLITMKEFPREDWPPGKLAGSHAKAAMYINWWHSGIKNTSKDFNRYYQEWKSALAETNREKADKNLRYITALGIAAMPFMIEKIEEGDLELIKVISYLSHSLLSVNASKYECLKWWDEKKEKYIINGVE